ncbi:hypothetical protein D1007_59062 [Hordeum vulgare]|nr:hypothetical protein D1007_59062 [Hordeum vulgare]
MEAFQPANLINVEVAHAQSRPADLVAGHVANAPAHKRQGNVVVQGDIPAGPPGREGAPGAAAAGRSTRPSGRTMDKVSGVKRKKVPTKKPPASTPSPRVRRSPRVPSYGDASTAGEVFDERAGSRVSNNAAAEFVNLLATNAVDVINPDRWLRTT